MKILCNECYQELTVHEYDIGIYVDTCECQKEKMEEALTVAENECDEAVDNAYAEGAESRDYDVNEADNEGYDRGYDIGYHEGFNEGFNEGKKEGYDTREREEN